MMFRTHPEAEQELTAAFQHYQEVVPGLGLDFLGEFFHAIGQVQKYPAAWPVIRKNARKFLLRRFPYALIYVPREEELWVVAVMHTSRKPFYWAHRLKN